MTYTEANHLSRAITNCVRRCSQSAEPYRELSDFISALRAGGVSEHYVQAINNAALRGIASMMVANATGPSAVPPSAAIPTVPGHGTVVAATCYILQ
jgi:hypothetical protein